MQDIEAARACVMGALRAVDLVVLFDEDSAAADRGAEARHPGQGRDEKPEEVVGADFVIAHGGRLVLAEIIPGRSTTALVKKATTKTG